MVKINCDWCNKEFETHPRNLKRHKNHFCSKSCSNKWQSKDRKGKKSGKDSPYYKRVEMECLQCGKKIMVKQCKSSKNNFCSVECYNKHKSDHRYGEDNPSWKGGKKEVVCTQCGKKFKKHPSTIFNNNFCSRKCKGLYNSFNHVGLNSFNYRGGKKLSIMRQNVKRRQLGNIHLNKIFNGCEGHHIGRDHVINIPVDEHKHKYHNQYTGQGMEEMNKKAFKYLLEHKEDMLISIEEAFILNLQYSGSDTHEFGIQNT